MSRPTAAPRRGRIARRALLALTLAATACSGDDDGSEAGGASGPPTTSAASTDATDAGEPAASTTASTSSEAEGEPVAGGKLVMGVEADTAQPWTPAQMSCAAACYQVIRSIYDPLTAFNADGQIEPYLAESVEPNADYTAWTITVRAGVTFHDGAPLDGAAVADNFRRQRASILTGRVLGDVVDDGVAVPAGQPLSVVITLSRPWVDFPNYLATQIGMIASPTWLAAVDADPTKATQPVGTGPFVFASYDAGEGFRATRNPQYWNQPYPYLDEVEFRIVADGLTRQRALEAGDLDVIHISTGQAIAELREQPDDFPMLEPNAHGESAFMLVNSASDNPALADRRVRCALANAQDVPALVDRVQDGVNQLSNGPFTEGTPGYLADSGYPTEQNMELAQQLIAEYKAEHPGSISITLSTTPDQINQTVAQAQAEWFEEAGIDDVQISTIEQGDYILKAVLGDYQLFQWRGAGGHTLDEQYIWWHSSNSQPNGEFALNFSRFKDPVIDDALDANRGETDPALKEQHAATVTRQFGSECYYLWTWRTTWGIPHRPDVQGLDTFVLPSGNRAEVGVPSNGTFNVAGAWLS